MLRWNFSRLLFLSVFFLAIGFLAKNNAHLVSAQDANTSLVMGDVSFNQKTSVDDALKLAKLNKVNILMLEGDFEVGSQTVHDFFVLQGQPDATSIENAYKQQRLTLLTDALSTKSKVSERQQKDLSTQFSEMEAAQKAQNVGSIKISRMLVNGTQDKVETLKLNQIAYKVEMSNPSNRTQKGESQVDNSVDIINKGTEATSPDRAKEVAVVITDNKSISGGPNQLSSITGTVMPNYGTFSTGQSSGSERYTMQYMRWGNINFTSNQTYEHDFFLYNYDRKTYMNTESSALPSCWPSVVYAATTWPSASSPYVDTRTLFPGKWECEKDEVSYTIGAAQADKLQAGVTYYTYIRTKNGNNSTGRFKLQGQLGYRNPSFCFSALCIYAESTSNMIPAWSNNVPGTQDWNFGLPAAPSGVSVSNPTINSLRVNFKDNATNETSVRIERKINGGGWSEFGYFSPLSGAGYWTWNNTGLARNTTYCYRLRTAVGYSYSSYSNEACGRTY